MAEYAGASAADAGEWSDFHDCVRGGVSGSPHLEGGGFSAREVGGGLCELLCCSAAVDSCGEGGGCRVWREGKVGAGGDSGDFYVVIGDFICGAGMAVRCASADSMRAGFAGGFAGGEGCGRRFEGLGSRFEERQQQCEPT